MNTECDDGDDGDDHHIAVADDDDADDLVGELDELINVLTGTLTTLLLAPY